MSTRTFLGIDTSNYTTSMALVDEVGNRIFDIRIPLKVREGGRGLRQQEAVFQHIKNLNEISEKIENQSRNIAVVTASSRPRMLDGSYMPVFEVSKSVGKLLSSLMGAEFIDTSHQRGHIRAAIENNLDVPTEFLAIHLSGGTLEIMKVCYMDGFLNEELLTGTSDISAGQLIDRIGVKLGFSFPAGREMERYLSEYTIADKVQNYSYKAYFKDSKLNLSGLENHLLRKIDEGAAKESIIYETFRNIAELIYDLSKFYSQSTGIKDVILTGGVAANSMIKNYLKQKSSAVSLEFLFCRSQDCTDNAYGVALIGMDQYKESGRKNKI
ncbi:Kae1-like domain-containing protein [Alkalibacter mobilis]|uniref:Kae1-like domain-containing protein n=1 Tax=Alkalibacter mobilis TaxID=2787712 RepID=UPI00189CEE84|nr:O-sialoglycoprotein endopeptidase [Alkalibacter mobilis]MBF7097110.1 O-sialoglycoprotein endopeptidase [Alkalibacter mobilis]